MTEGRRETWVQSDLYQAIFPIYHLGKLCGIIPVRFFEITGSRYQSRYSVTDIVYSLCWLGVLLGAEFWGLWRDLKDGWENSTRLKSRTAMIATCSDVLGIMSLACVCVLGSSFRWKYLRIVIDRLVEIDEKIGIVAPKQTRRFTIALTVCSLIYLLVAAILDMIAWDRQTKDSKKMTDKGPINYAPLYFMYMTIILTEIQYSVSAYNVGQRFVRLNKRLEDLFKRGRITDSFRKDLGLAGDLQEQGNFTQKQYTSGVRVFRKSNDLESSKYASNITELIMIHSSLCDTVTFINNAFGHAILFVTVTCLLHLTVAPYFMILQADGKHEWLFLTVHAMWCIFHLARMLIIVQPTYATLAEGKKTAVLASQLLSTNYGIDARKELEIFSLQLLHRPLEFTACGLFTLDRTLVTSMAGAVTTYLVILIQFQNADDTKGDVDIIRNASQMLKNASTLSNFTGLKLL